MKGRRQMKGATMQPEPIPPRDPLADPREMQRRADVADEMLAKLIDDIGTGAGVASLRRQALDVKRELRGLRGLPILWNSTAP